MPGLLIHTSPYKQDCISYLKMTPARSSPSPSPSPTSSPRPTIHSRRTLSYRLRRSSSQSPPPVLSGLGISGLALPVPTLAPESTNSTVPFQFQVPERGESDAECWSRMLALQREYHCYNSARLEAAVEAMENGWGEDAVQMPSRLCLDLLNEQLREKMRVWSEY
ncbi:hypothetical protein EG329_004985 [Mollisiaceae sp. DMI_Dod_QoI]|nr:hypothetical protein EG329_004985 [Helotiales sp. DMI_Dod_QoI]